MADVTEIIHKITYEVNNDALNNATKSIQAQIVELNSLQKTLAGYVKELDRLSNNEAKKLDQLITKIDDVNRKIVVGANKTKGALAEALKGFSDGIGIKPELKDAISKYVSGVNKQYKELAKSGEVYKKNTIGFYKETENAATKSTRKSVLSLKNLGKSLASTTGLLDVGISLLFMFGEELLREGGILDKFAGKQKKVVTETENIITQFANLTQRVSELAADELTSSKLLYETATDVNQTYKLRVQAVEELQSKYPAYFGNLSKEAILAGEAADKYAELNNAIIAKATVEVYTEELKELIKQQKIIEDNLKKTKPLFDGLKQNEYVGKGKNREFVPGIANNNKKIDQNTQKLIAQYDAERLANLEKQKELSQQIFDIQKKFQGIFLKGGGSTTTSNPKVVPQKPKREKVNEPLYLEPRRLSQIPNEIEPPKIEKREIPQLEEEQKGLTDKQKENIKEGIDGYQMLAQAAADAYNTIIQAQIEALDKEISVREKRVEAAKKLAERGNTEALKLEEDRLRKAEAKRAQFAKRQQAINAAITVSNAIAAVARAALEGGGFGSIATIAALIAALAAGYAAVTSMSQDGGGDAFADGVVGYQGKGGPRDDKNWVRISTGESVITAEGTQRNRAFLEAINNGAAFSTINLAAMPMLKHPKSLHQGQYYATAKELNGLEKKLDDVVYAIEGNKLKQNIFFDEQGVGIMTERAINKNRKRWK